MGNIDIEKLRQETADWAVKYIKSGSGFPWLRDKFNALCGAMGANEFDPNDIGFELEDISNALKEKRYEAEINRRDQMMQNAMQYGVEAAIEKGDLSPRNNLIEG